MLKAFLFLSLLASSSLAQTVTKVVDGDTFKIDWNGKTETVRLIGVDAPESRNNRKARKDAARSNKDLESLTALGKRSTEHLKHILPVGTPIRLEFDVRQRDRYGRLLAYVYLSDSSMLNESLIKSGYAVPMTVPPNVKYVERFRR